MDLGMDLVHTKSEPKFGLDIQRETSSSLAGIHGSHGICGAHGINGIHGHFGIHGINDSHGIHGFQRMSMEAMGSWIPRMKAWNPRIPWNPWNPWNPDGYPTQPSWKTPQAHPNDIDGL